MEIGEFKMGTSALTNLIFCIYHSPILIAH